MIAALRHLGAADDNAVLADGISNARRPAEGAEVGDRVLDIVAVGGGDYRRAEQASGDKFEVRSSQGISPVYHHLRDCAEGSFATI